MLKNILKILVAFSLLFISGCNSNSESEVTVKEDNVDNWIQFGEPFDFLSEQFSKDDFKNKTEEQQSAIMKDILQPTLVELTGVYYNREEVSTGDYISQKQNLNLTICYNDEDEIYVLPFSLTELKDFGITSGILPGLVGIEGIDFSKLKEDDRFNPYLYKYAFLSYDKEQEAPFYVFDNCMSLQSQSEDKTNLDSESTLEPNADVWLSMGLNLETHMISLRGFIPNIDLNSISTVQEWDESDDKSYLRYDSVFFFQNSSDAHDYSKKLEEYEAELKRQQALADYEKMLAESEPWIGMTADQVEKSSWGKPKDINTTITRYTTREQWCYGDGRYVYLENGIVTAIQK